MFTIGTDNAYPYHFLDEHGKPGGMIGEVITEAARRSGIRLEWRLHKEGPVPAVAQQAVDLWPLLSPRHDLYPAFYFTRPYLRNSYVQLSIDPAFDQPDGGRRVRKAAVAGLRMVSLFARQVYPAAEVVAQGSRADALAAVCSGRADVMLVETRAAEQLLLTRPPGCENARFHTLGVDLPEQVLAIGAGPRAIPVANRLREEIDRMLDDGTMRRILHKWDYFYGGESEALYQAAVARRASYVAVTLATVLAVLAAILLVLLLRIRRARQAAIAANSAKSLFIANISHEIRTPMNGVIGMLHLAKDSDDSKMRLEHIESALHSADALLALLNDVLDFSKIEAGRAEIHTAPFQVAGLARQAMLNIEGRAKQKGLTTSCEIADGVPQWVEGDDVRIRQVLLNLLSNAVKFTDTGTVSLRLDCTNLDPERVVLNYTITDSGIGMSTEQQRHVFEAFRQGDDTTTRRFGGTGLGLAISKELTKMMGGDITLQSEEGKGSTFHFSVTVRRTQAPASATAVRGSGSAEAAPVRALRILLAEDNPINQRVAAAYLTRRGHKTVVANDGREAVERAVVGGYDIILMDIQMPIIDGIEATRRIRESEAGTGKHVRIVALTAHALREGLDSCLGAGMDDYLVKPFSPEDLFAKVESAQSQPSPAEQ